MDGHHTNIHRADWQAYPAQDGTGEHTVVGTLKVLPNVRGPQLNSRRDVLVYLPASYTKSDWRYPVIYMQDGQMKTATAKFHPTPSGSIEWAFP